MVFVIGGVAFLTLLERKVLGYICIHKGPNRVGFVGIFQPFKDAITLFFTQQYFPLVSNYLIYYLSLIFGVFLYITLPCSQILRNVPSTETVPKELEKRNNGYTGVGRIYTGVRRIYTGVGRIYTGVGRIYTGVGRIYTGVGRIYTGVRRIYTGVGRIYTGVGRIYTGVGKIYTGVGKIYTGVGRIYTGVGRIYTGVGRIYTGVGRIYTGVGRIYTGVGRIHTDVGRIYTGGQANYWAVMPQKKNNLHRVSAFKNKYKNECRD
jgi:hypothetical protein